MRKARIILAASLVAITVAGVMVAVRTVDTFSRVHVTGYFANSNGVFVGDDVRILGVPVGKIENIQPQTQRVKIDFWYDDKYRVPADAKAAIISPSLVSVRAIQLTPAYVGGAWMPNGAVIPEDRTAVPVEFDDLRVQLQRLTEALQPTAPGGVSTLGAFVDTAADNLRGQGATIRDALTKLSQAFSALGDHSSDIFSTIKNVSILVSALQSSQDVLRQLNRNLAGVTGLLADGPQQIGDAVSDLNSVVGEVRTFVAENRESLGTTVDKLAAVSALLDESKEDLKQTLHVAAPAFQNFINIYQPAQGTLSGALAANNFANPIQFLCSAVQAASRLGAEQSSKLCVQYLAPILKNRQYNFPPLGENLFVGPSARPNEVTYSEDWMRPDYIPPSGAQPPPSQEGAPGSSLPPAGSPFTAYGAAANPDNGAAPHAPPREPALDGVEFQPAKPVEPVPASPIQTSPSAGLPGMMVPPSAPGGQ